MTKQAKSADDILDIFHNEPAPDGFTKDTQPTALIRSAAVLMYRKAESELLPIINQQAQEIEKLKAESESRWQLAESSINNSAKMSAELIALQSRFDELVKGLEGARRFDFVRYDDAPHDSGMEEESSGEYVEYSLVQSIISKAKGGANGKV